MHFNDEKAIFDQESSDDYSNKLNNMIEKTLIPKLESLITLNQNILRIKNKSTKR